MLILNSQFKGDIGFVFISLIQKCSFPKILEDGKN